MFKHRAVELKVVNIPKTKIGPEPDPTPKNSPESIAIEVVREVGLTIGAIMVAWKVTDLLSMTAAHVIVTKIK